MDKLIRFALLPRGGEPVIWDFGSAAKHHQLYNPWLDYDREPGDRELSEAARSGTSGARAGISTLRGAFHPDAGIAEEVARKVATVLREHDLDNAPLGVDLVEMPILAALRAEGIDVVDGQQVFLEARRIKTVDEIALLTQACSMVDAAYEELYRLPSARGPRERVRRAGQQGALRPRQRVRRRGQRHLRRALLSASARLQRPDRPAGRSRVLRHPAQPPRLPDLLLPLLLRRQCVTGRCGTPTPAAASTWTWPSQRCGRGRRPPTSCRCGRRAEEFGFANEEAAFALQYGHGVGLSIWEKPIFSRLVSLDHPETLEEGMVFALETYWPGADGWSAARIEEEVVVTADGCEVITKFPAEDLLIAGQRYFDRRRRAAPACARRSRTSTPSRAARRHDAGHRSAVADRRQRRIAGHVRADGRHPRGREGGVRPLHVGAGQGHDAPGLRP